MFRPSRPMMRPFISSLGSATDDTEISEVCSEAIRCTASATIFCASRSAFFFALLADLAQPIGRVCFGLALQSRDQLDLGLGCGHSGERLQSAPLVGDELLQFLLAPLDRLLLATEVAGAPAEFAVTLVEEVDLLLELVLALVDAPFLALDLFAPVPRLDLPGLAELDQLFLPGEHRALAQRLGLALGVADDALGQLLGARLGEALRLAFSLLSASSPEDESRCGSHNCKHANYSDKKCRIRVHLCSTAVAPRRRGKTAAANAWSSPDRIADPAPAKGAGRETLSRAGASTYVAAGYSRQATGR